MDTRPVRKIQPRCLHSKPRYHEQSTTKKTNIQVQYSGGWYSARYFGNAGKVFGATPEAAILRLKTGK